MNPINPKRIRKAMKATFTEAHAAIRDARESGSVFAAKVALETVRACRKRNSDRRRALVLGHTV